MEHFAYVLYVGFGAQRNLCDKQNVLFYGTPRRFFIISEFDGMNADDIFRKLSRGVSFDRRKFKEDAENLGIIEKKDEPECEVNAKDSIFITPMNQSESTDDSTNQNQENFIIEEFSEKVEKRILSNLENILKWEKPTRIQMAAIDILLKVRFPL